MSVLQFPMDRGAPRPVSPVIAVQRLTLDHAADWQLDILSECRRQKTLTPSMLTYLKRTGLLSRCTFLASLEPSSPLLFQYLGEGTLSVLGRAWGRSVLNQPEAADPHSEYAHRIGLQYVEAIGGGEALFNRISVTGLGRPFVYTQALYGWADNGRRAILSCIDVQTLH
jgi:hypothetical protein